MESNFLFQKILVNLEINNILNLSSASKIFFNLLQDHNFWYEYFKKRGRILKHKPKSKIKSYYDNYLYFDKIQNYLDFIKNFPNLREELGLIVDLDNMELDAFKNPSGTRTYTPLQFNTIFREVNLGSREEEIRRLWNDFINLYQVYQTKIQTLLSGNDFEFVYVYIAIIPHKEGLIKFNFMCDLDDPNYEDISEAIYFYQSDIKIILSNLLQQGIKITTMNQEKKEIFKD